MDKLGQEEIDESKAPFLEHLEELRWRLWRAVATMFVATCVCFAFHDLIFVFLTKPLFYVLEQQNLESALKFRTVPGAFLFHFKTAILGGIFLSVPLVLFQLCEICHENFPILDKLFLPKTQCAIHGYGKNKGHMRVPCNISNAYAMSSG